MPRKKKVQETNQFDVTLIDQSPGSATAQKTVKTVTGNNEQDALRSAQMGDTNDYEQMIITPKRPGMQPMTTTTTTAAVPGLNKTMPQPGMMESKKLKKLAEKLKYPYSIMVPGVYRKMISESVAGDIKLVTRGGSIYFKVADKKQMFEFLTALNKIGPAIAKLLTEGIGKTS